MKELRPDRKEKISLWMFNKTTKSSERTDNIEVTLSYVMENKETGEVIDIDEFNGREGLVKIIFGSDTRRTVEEKGLLITSKLLKGFR